MQPATTSESIEPNIEEEEVGEEVEREPKRERLALKKEGVEKINLREGLRERKPAVGLQTKYGEKVNW